MPLAPHLRGEVGSATAGRGRCRGATHWCRCRRCSRSARAPGCAVIEFVDRILYLLFPFFSTHRTSIAFRRPRPEPGDPYARQSNNRGEALLRDVDDRQRVSSATRSLLGAFGIATRSDRTLLGAAGRTIRSQDATSSKKLQADKTIALQVSVCPQFAGLLGRGRDSGSQV